MYSRMCNVTAVPLVVVEEILMNLPADHVVLNCRLVCHEWKELVDSAAHWRARCRREGLKSSRPPDDWCLFYFQSKKRRNLLKNPRADDCLNGWEIVRNGGDGWEAHDTRNPFPDSTLGITHCFVTSFGLCLKQQLIDLKKEGYSPAFMDHWQPNIKISDWYTPRSDCGSYYEICVRLLGQNKEVIRTFQPDKVYFPQWNDEQWCHMTHVFKNYGPGVRFIHFIHGGKDTKFWKGWYGIRLTNSSVEICPDDDA
ncbi:F-box only protein 6-like [Triplophysa rosa]|uniref:F-box only protein 6-like n=1 Tax=Triplophysa rosa TaxID=992332 RepID=UPI002545EC15|nr:F-box only protein 6-like [Triplophysa rosa]